jgi:sulfate adenylyltransferase
VALVPVHGGLSAPVDRSLPLTHRKQLTADAALLPSIAVTKADLATVHRIADGTLSPLGGFMTADLYERVLSERCVVSNGAPYAWTIPLSLPVTQSEAERLVVGKRAILRDPEGAIVGFIDVASIFPWDKDRYVSVVYGTERKDHPGADMVMKDERTTLVGGEIRAFRPRANPAYGHLVLTPIQTRALIESKGWERALAFQTRNPLHRAHEYALVYGIEQLTRQGFYAGVVLNPLIGELKGDDVDAVTRMSCYMALRDQRLLGQGDRDESLWDGVGYDLNEVFDLVGLDIKMFYGGPSEAVMHAIYRQNHGFSDIVIGRKHADAPYFDGTPIWGDFDAQEIFSKLGGELHTRPVKVGFAAYYDVMGRVDLMENHPGEKPYSISGTKVREILVSGERPDSRILRPQIADILIGVYLSRNG